MVSNASMGKRFPMWGLRAGVGCLLMQDERPDLYFF